MYTELERRLRSLHLSSEQAQVLAPVEWVERYRENVAKLGDRYNSSDASDARLGEGP